MISETNSEIGLRHCCAIGSIGWNGWLNELEQPAYWQLFSAPLSLANRKSGSKAAYSALSSPKGVKSA